MRLFLILLIMFVVTFAIPGTLYAQETDPVTVILARTEAMNAGDVNAAIAYFADDATYKLNDPPPGAREMYTGREEILGRLLELVAVNAKMDVEVRQVEGDIVTVLTRFSDDPLSEMGVDFIEGVEEYTVQDGKITAYEWTLTEESGVKIAAAMSAPATLPESGGNTFPIYAILSILGGLVLVIGLGLALRYNRST